MHHKTDENEAFSLSSWGAQYISDNLKFMLYINIYQVKANVHVMSVFTVVWRIGNINDKSEQMEENDS